MTMVEGTINGFPFRAALEPDGNGSHWLRLSKALQDAAGISGGEGVGDTVTLEITRVGEEPECRVPMDLRQALELPSPPTLQGAQALSALWGEITPMARRDWILWIALPSKRKRAGAGSRMRATCLHRESAGLVVCRASTGAGKILTSHQTKHGFRCRTQKVVLRRDRQSRKVSAARRVTIGFAADSRPGPHWSDAKPCGSAGKGRNERAARISKRRISTFSRLLPGGSGFDLTASFQRQQHAIGPTKSILARVFAAARFQVSVNDVIFFHELAGPLEHI